MQVGTTWIFAAFVPLDEAHNEQDQDEEGNGAHQPDEPPLSGDVDLPAGCSWVEHSRGLSAAIGAGSLWAIKLKSVISMLSDNESESYSKISTMTG